MLTLTGPIGEIGLRGQEETNSGGAARLEFRRIWFGLICQIALCGRIHAQKPIQHRRCCSSIPTKRTSSCLPFSSHVTRVNATIGINLRSAVTHTVHGVSGIFLNENLIFAHKHVAAHIDSNRLRKRLGDRNHVVQNALLWLFDCGTKIHILLDRSVPALSSTAEVNRSTQRLLLNGDLINSGNDSNGSQ